MAFVIKNPPEFTTDVEQWTRKTDADGAEMAKVIEKLLNNEVFLKVLLEALDGNALKDGDKGVTGGVASLGNDGKLEQHVEYDHVDNVPVTQWNKIEGKPSYYPPSSHKHEKSEVGLGNVNNTADSDKSVKYAAGAGDADTVDGKHASAFALSSHAHSYLPLSGGTMTGPIINNYVIPLCTESGSGISWTRGGEQHGYPILTCYGNYFGLYPYGWDTTEWLRKGLLIGQYYTGDSLQIISSSNNIYDLGSSGRKFKTLYATTGTIQTSDRTLKNNIDEFDSNFIKKFIMGLKPVSYKLNNGDSGRTHYGLIAQDVEELMESLKMNSKDFAGFIKSPKTEDVVNPETKEIGIKVIEGEYNYSLRYEEFISPLIKMIQIQQQMLECLQKQITRLELTRE